MNIAERMADINEQIFELKNRLDNIEFNLKSLKPEYDIALKGLCRMKPEDAPKILEKIKYYTSQKEIVESQIENLRKESCSLKS